MTDIRGAFGATWRGVSGGVATTRRRVPALDHAIRAYGRYTSDGGDRLAAGATYFAFLSFFPIIALIYAGIGFVVDAYPDAKEELVKQINGYLPGLADKLNISTLGSAKIGVGVIGLLGLMLAGVACVSALRDAIRLMWHQSTDAGNLITRRLRDISVLAGLGLLLVVSLALTSVATSANGVLLRATGLDGSTVAAWLAGLLGFVLALIADTLVFLYLFWRLPKETNRRAVVRAALLGAVGLEVFKLLGTWLVGKATGNPVYGTFAVIVGLLIWINILMRWILFAAAWAVTAPGDSDIHPSGTAHKQDDADTPDGTGTDTQDHDRTDARHRDGADPQDRDRAAQPDDGHAPAAGQRAGQDGAPGRDQNPSLDDAPSQGDAPSENRHPSQDGTPSPSQDQESGDHGAAGQPEPADEHEHDNRRWVADLVRRVVPRRQPGNDAPGRRDNGRGPADADAPPETTPAAPAPERSGSGRQRP